MLSDYNNIQINTDNLILKTISMEYLEDIFREFNPDIARFIPAVAPTKILETAEFINKSLFDIIQKTTITFVILNKINQEFMGVCALQDIQKSAPSFGIWVKKSVQNRGIGFETINSLKVWAIKNFEFFEFNYKTRLDNLASNKTAQKLGGVLVNKFTETNFELDEIITWNVYKII